jgi:hypothetical protein
MRADLTSSERRLSTLVRHLCGLSSSPCSPSRSSSENARIALAPMAALGSVFAHVVQAPEDPILGVRDLSRFTFHFSYLGLAFIVYSVLLDLSW